MSILRLGAFKLPAAEVVLVQTLFRLYSHGDAFRWTFVTAPPYDALLVDGTADDGKNPDIDRMAKAVLRLTRMHAGRAPNTLERPVRADRLHDWLKSTEHELLSTRPAVAADGAVDAAADGDSVVDASPLRFKLRRWPAAALLRGDPQRIRMATLLSRRALSAAELATLTQQPEPECQAFLTVLQSTGLVDLPQPAAPTPALTGNAAAVATHTPPPPFARGLIAGIRRRLGL